MIMIDLTRMHKTLPGVSAARSNTLWCWLTLRIVYGFVPDFLGPMMERPNRPYTANRERPLCEMLQISTTALP